MNYTKDIGNLGENIAKKYLINKGYIFITGNYKSSHREIDLIFQFKQEKLFELSHTCNMPGLRCGGCNGCNERRWGFEQMSYKDPGIL